jgi:hypothetical protein
MTKNEFFGFLLILFAILQTDTETSLAIL